MMDVYGTTPLRATDILNSVKDRSTSVQLIVVNVCVLFVMFDSFVLFILLVFCLFVYLFVCLFVYLSVFLFFVLFCCFVLFCFVLLFCFTQFTIFLLLFTFFSLFFFFKLCFIFLFQSDMVLVWFGGVVKAIFCALGALFVVKKNQAFKSLQSHL